VRITGRHEWVKVKPRLMYPIMGNLPKSLVESTRPFSISGVDYAGPIYIKECRGRSKRTVKAYICVFVCFSTKAVHLELYSISYKCASKQAMKI
jgi:hypothetical protein